MNTSMKSIDLEIKPDGLFILCGPCVVESEEITFTVAENVVSLCKELGIQLIFKASYRKANRSSGHSYTGMGDDEALAILGKVKDRFKIPVVTDFHSAQEAAFAAKVADVLQVPAFLARQTDILEAAARTGKVVNIKKGQFMSAGSMKFAAEKVADTGNTDIMLTERGTFFGYQDLVVDFRGIPTMKKFGYPVVMDCTHSLQQPNQPGGVTGGNPELIQTMALAAVASGTDGLFIETHPNPAEALSDGANMLPLHKLRGVLTAALAVKKTMATIS